MKDTDELIRKSDAIKAVGNYIYKAFDYLDLNVAKDDAREILSDVPTIDAVERKRGEWQKLPKYEYIMCCSECGWVHDVLHYGDKYCPNCGARMKGADDDRDYERAIEQMEHDMLYELTYNPEDGSM